MKELNKKLLQCCSMIMCPLFMALIRIIEVSNIITMILVIGQICILIWNMRHIKTKKQKLFLMMTFVTIYIIRVYGYTESAVDLLIGVVAGLIVFAVFNIECLFKKHQNSPLFCLILPVVFYIFMLLVDVINLNIAFRIDSYFSSFLLLTQSVAIFGVYFIDFFAVLTSSVIIYVLDHGLKKKSVIVLTCYILVFTILLVFGAVRLNHKENKKDTEVKTIRVACTTGPYCGNFLVDSVANSFEEIEESISKIVAAAVFDDVDIIVFSEEAYSVNDYQKDQLLNFVCKLAKENAINILFPYEVLDNDDSENGKGINELCWINAEGEIIYSYIKCNLVPLVETFDYVRGEKAATTFDIQINGMTLKAGAVICYDSDFDIYLNKNVKDADILFVPCWDWQAVARQRVDIAALEAISLDTTIIRSVYDGYHAVIDNTGLVLAKDNCNDIGYEEIAVYDISINTK